MRQIEGWNNDVPGYALSVLIRRVGDDNLTTIDLRCDIDH